MRYIGCHAAALMLPFTMLRARLRQQHTRAICCCCYIIWRHAVTLAAAMLTIMPLLSLLPPYDFFRAARFHVYACHALPRCHAYAARSGYATAALLFMLPRAKS